MGLLTGGAKAGKKVAKNLLDMATEARMKRAAEQGYGPETWYHGTNSDFDEFLSSDMEGNWPTRRVHHFTKDTGYASALGNRVLPVKIKDGNFKKIDADGYSLSRDPDRVEKLISDGYDGVFTSDGQAIAFDPANIRSINAAFDPSKRNSANLLAGAAGTAGVGLLGAGASNKGYAAPPTANDIFAQYGNEQQIQPAQHPKLAQAAGLLQGVETPLDGLLGAGWATEGVTGLLDKLSYGDKRKYSDYVKAAMDFF